MALQLLFQWLHEHENIGHRAQNCCMVTKVKKVSFYSSRVKNGSSPTASQPVWLLRWLLPNREPLESAFWVTVMWPHSHGDFSEDQNSPNFSFWSQFEGKSGLETLSHQRSHIGLVKTNALTQRARKIHVERELTQKGHSRGLSQSSYRKPSSRRKSVCVVLVLLCTCAHNHVIQQQQR